MTMSIVGFLLPISDMTITPKPQNPGQLEQGPRDQRLQKEEGLAGKAGSARWPERMTYLT